MVSWGMPTLPARRIGGGGWCCLLRRRWLAGGCRGWRLRGRCLSALVYWLVDTWRFPARDR